MHAAEKKSMETSVAEPEPEPHHFYCRSRRFIKMNPFLNFVLYKLKDKGVGDGAAAF
jgi:hypothetical protein